MVQVKQTTSILTRKDHWGHVLARLGFRRSSHRVEPGLYILGAPDENAPVYVTANYTLSFDALRSALEGMHAYILVLDTKGVNVWCAAGKGTFGTGELVARAKSIKLGEVVKHRTLILPQLGATGVSAHLVKEQCGFEVEYGPVRAEDLPRYLETHSASAEMRQSRFNFADRLVLAPVEVVHTCLPMVVLGALAFLLGGWFYLAWALTRLAGSDCAVLRRTALAASASVQRQGLHSGRADHGSLRCVSIFTGGHLDNRSSAADYPHGTDQHRAGRIRRAQHHRLNPDHILDERTA